MEKLKSMSKDYNMERAQRKQEFNAEYLKTKQEIDA